MDHNLIIYSLLLALAYAVVKLWNYIFNPYPELKDIPTISFVDIIMSMLKRETTLERKRRLYAPAMKEKGIAKVWHAGNWHILVSRPEMARQILLRSDRAIDLDRFTLQRKFFGQTNLFHSEGDNWRRHRKVVNPAFHRSWSTQPFGEVTVSLFKQIDKLDGKHIPMEDLMKRLTLDALGKIAFNFEFHALDDQLGKYAVAWEQIRNGLSQILFQLFPWLDIFAFLIPSRKKMNEAMKDMDELLYRIIEEKRTEIQNGKYHSADTQDVDLLALMIEATDAEDPMLTKKELRDNLAMFFFVGHETTQISLSIAVYYLAVNSDIQQRAREEVERILGPGEKRDMVPTIEDVKKMEYIMMVIKEMTRNCTAITTRRGSGLKGLRPTRRRPCIRINGSRSAAGLGNVGGVEWGCYGGEDRGREKEMVWSGLK
ncbi:cytochrome P450 [Jimgerdemannia flammicorona]|uniref:Cytochrome P450 n=1 Tax=Jimgerdemannia flammicorona TaxID=994334 RepID=A0A433CX63_9FUNG|nr:cytochrome P450 [Jimgerdemannia flammicorona]